MPEKGPHAVDVAPQPGFVDIPESFKKEEIYAVMPAFAGMTAVAVFRLFTVSSSLEGSMCLARLYPPGAEQPAMENITQISIENGKIVAHNLFGERQVFEDAIQTISFTDSRVQLVKTAG